MTTIAAKFSTLEIAADSMVSDESSFYHVNKLRKGKNSIYGGCGDWSKVLQAFNLIDSGKADWESDLDVTILELRTDGIWVYENTIIPTHLKNDFWAVGTGANYAIAAMHLGLSPREAVEIACIYDTSSNQPIDSLKLEVKSGGKKSIR